MQGRADVFVFVYYSPLVVLSESFRIYAASFAVVLVVRFLGLDHE